MRGGRLLPKPRPWGPLSAPPVAQESRFSRASGSVPCRLNSDLAPGRARRTVSSYEGPVAEGAGEREAGRGPGSQGGRGSSREDSPSSSPKFPVQEPRDIWAVDATSQTQSLSHLPEVGHLIRDKARSWTGSA